MKKILILSTLFLTMYGFSQSREKGTIEVAPLVGYASSLFYDSSYMNNSSINSVNLGVNGDYFFNNRWSLRSGLLYQTMGTEYSLLLFNPIIQNQPSDNAFIDYYKLELNYLTIPVNANWHFGSTRKWNLNFGPSIGFLLSSKDNLKSSLEELNTFQIGFNFGIGYKIEVSEKFSILIDYQEMVGLSNVLKENSDVRNIYGSFNVGGVFKL